MMDPLMREVLVALASKVPDLVIFMALVLAFLKSQRNMLKEFTVSGTYSSGCSWTSTATVGSGSGAGNVLGWLCCANHAMARRSNTSRNSMNNFLFIII